MSETYQSYISRPFFSPLGKETTNEQVLARLTGQIDPQLALEYMLAAGASRRYLETESVDIVETSKHAIRHALEISQIELKQLDGVIYTSLFRDTYEPSTAAFIAAALERPRLKTLDITTACSGMAHGIEVASGWLHTNRDLGHIALVSVDLPMRAIDWEINSADELVTKGSGLTLGAAASALIVSRSTPTVGIGVRRFVGYDDATCAPLCTYPIGGLFSSDSNRLVRPTIESLMKVRKSGEGLRKDTWVLPHQPSVHVARFSKFLGVEQDRIIITHDRYGNTASSAWVSAYHHLLSRRFSEVQHGDPVLIKTMAGGFSSLGIVGSFVKAEGRS